MTKWPNDAIEGVKVHKVIPRPTALRAVGKNGEVHLSGLSIKSGRNSEKFGTKLVT
jgi:hypothetical protein